MLFNPTDSELSPYGAYIVDVAGEQPTRQLWPNRHDCPKGKPAPPAVGPHDGRLALEAPTEAYNMGCDPVPLSPGDYIVVVDAGYGDDLYAAAKVTLPLEHSVQLEYRNRYEEPRPCTPELARRATRLALRAAADELPRGFMDGCDVDAVVCSDSAEPPSLPPDGCRITLAQGVLRIERPAGDDTPRWLTAHAHREAVWVRFAGLTRTSASEIRVDGEPIRFAGTTQHHIHEHGGDAARIYGMEIDIDNPLDRPLRYRVVGIEQLVDYSCGLPNEVRGRPSLREATPATIAPGRSTLSLLFEPQEAYQSHCDRFATRVRLKVEGEAVAVTSEHQVTRIEPMREP